MRRKHYLVISLGDLAELKNRAEAQVAQSRGGHTPSTACVVLDLESDSEFVSSEGRSQIVTHYLPDALRPR